MERVFSIIMEIECYNVEYTPFDTLFEICKFSGSLALLTTSKTLSNYITIGVTLDFMVFLGYDVKISRTYTKETMIIWTLNGLLHRRILPAIEYSDGEKRWFRHDILHREEGPAIECPNGGKRWYRNGKLHREDGPAFEDPSGKAWYYHGDLHRIGAPALEMKNGDKEWYYHGKLHRLNGPAMERANGRKEWYVNGALHPGFDHLFGA